MHKALAFRCDDPGFTRSKLLKKNIIFLDIDEVIAYTDAHTKEDHDYEQTIDYLCERYDTDVYRGIATFYVCHAFYDWNESALGYLKRLVYETNSYIVIHSDWRDILSLEELRALFDLYDMSDYILDVCGIGTKEIAIRKYLNENADRINNYVVLDDSYRLSKFENNFVLVEDCINHEAYKKALKILSARN